MATSRVWAVGMMRDEADVAGAVLAHLADEGVDGIIVADNRSTDTTRAVLDEAAAEITATHGIPVEVVDDPEVGYYQSRKMTALAETAADRGADWIVPFDADEVWLAHDGRLGDVLRALPPRVTTAAAALWNHYRTDIDPPDPCPFRSMVYRHPDRGALPKLAFRWQPGTVVHQGNHGVTLPAPGREYHRLEIRHFPYRSWEHFRRKAVNGAEAYRSTDLPEHEGAHWRQYGALLDRHGEQALRDVYDRYFSFRVPALDGLILDPAPWCRWRP